MALLVYQRVNLHGFSMVFQWVFPLKPPFSYGFPMVFPLKPPFSYGFPMDVHQPPDGRPGGEAGGSAFQALKTSRSPRAWLGWLGDTKNGSCAGFGGPMKVPRINEALINEFNQAIISGWWFGPLPKKNPDLGCGIIQCINLPFGYD